MSLLSRQVNNLKYAPHYETGIAALAALGAARMALYESPAADRSARLDAFLQQKDQTREALLPLRGLSPEAVGGERYFSKWDERLNDIETDLRRKYAFSPDPENFQLKGMKLTQMLDPAYVPKEESRQDVAMNWQPFRFSKGPPSAISGRDLLADARFDLAQVNFDPPAGPALQARSTLGQRRP